MPCIYQDLLSTFAGARALPEGNPKYSQEILIKALNKSEFTVKIIPSKGFYPNLYYK